MNKAACDLNRDYLEAQLELCMLVSSKFRSALAHLGVLRRTDGPEREDGISSVSRACELDIAKCQGRIREIAATAEAVGCRIPFESLSSEHELDEDERTILALIFNARIYGWHPEGLDLLMSLRSSVGNPLAKAVLLGPAGKLRQSGLLEREQGFPFSSSLLTDDFSITPKAFWPIAGVPDWQALEERPSSPAKLDSPLCSREPRITFEQLVYPPETQDRLEEVVWRCSSGKDAFVQYGLEQRIRYGRGTAVLFHGPPGTGKTAAAEAIAARLGRKLAVVKYDQLQSRYVGDSEKRIVQVFRSALEDDCVLLFDEAEALFGRRTDERNSTDRYANGMTNILMQEIENYTNLVILTTNRRMVMDEAFERRLAMQIEFPEPGAEQRAGIWECLLAECRQLGPDVSYEELGARYEIAGGKIKNAVQRAVITAARRNAPVTMAMLMDAADAEAGRQEMTRRVGF